MEGRTPDIELQGCTRVVPRVGTGPPRDRSLRFPVGRCVTSRASQIDTLLDNKPSIYDDATKPEDKPMKIEGLGHVVIKVSNLEKAEAFYEGILGMPVVARSPKAKMSFFSLGNHHDFALMALGDKAESPSAQATGLAHVAFKIGNDLDTLREALAHLTDAGIKAAPVDHEVTQSLYFADPDGNQVELYVDVSDAWREEPQRVAQAKALEL